MSSTVRNVLGAPPSQFVGRPFVESVIEADRACVARLLADARAAAAAAACARRERRLPSPRAASACVACDTVRGRPADEDVDG